MGATVLKSAIFVCFTKKANITRHMHNSTPNSQIFPTVMLIPPKGKDIVLAVASSVFK